MSSKGPARGGQGTPKKAAKKPAARGSAPAGAKGSRRRRASAPARRGPSGADVLAVLVLGGLISLAACVGPRGPARTPANPAGPEGEVTVQFLDVGQGDAVLVRSPEGKTMLYDGGRSAERMRGLLAANDVTKIDLLVASHADADHIAGLVPAAQQARPTLFVNNGLAGTTQTWERLVTALQEAGTTFQTAKRQVINLGSVKVRVIAPPAGMREEQNVNSVGVRIEFGEFRALLTGDSEKPETLRWLEEDRPEAKGPFQVYKSIHHGAANGDHPAWLANVRPENVVISVGDNSYGHPTPEALRLYEAQGARVYRTDVYGTVTFKGRGDGSYTVSRER